MSLLQLSADYTDRDFDSLRTRLIALVKSAFPEWTDFDVANFGNVLVELFAFVGDVLAGYQDAQAREGRVTTATQRKSMIALARMLGYTIPGASAATAEVAFTLAAATGADVTIPAGTEVRTPEVVDPVRFQLLEDVVIAAGDTAGTGTVEHSTSHEQTFAASALASQEVALDRTPFLDSSAVVSASNGAYTQVSSFLESGPTDRHYVVLVDQNDRATIRFGDGVRGAPPTGTITVGHKTGGGAAGNVEATRLRVIDGVFTDAEGRSVRITCSNAAAASGGSDRQTIEEARLAIPESIRAGDRSVTREDFEINARAVSGVARALMTTSNEDDAVDENAGIIYVIPEGGGTPTQALLDAVETMLTVTKPHTLTFSLQVLAPVYETVDVWVRVTFAAGQTPATVKARIDAALEAFFAVSKDDGTPNTAVDFGINLEGQAIAWSDVFDAIRDVAGVRKIAAGDLLLNNAAADVALDVREFPVYGTLTVIDATTGAIVP